MAIRYATKAGVWSDVTVWDGGVSFPASTDDVYANNFAVSINQTITVNSLKKIAGGSAVAGGGFTVTTAATVNITAGIAAADNVTNSTTLLTVDAGSAAVTINGNVTGGAATSRTGLGVASGYTGALVVNGNLVGGSASAFALSVLASGAQVTVNGNVSGASAHAVNNSAASAQITINGTVTGGTASSIYGVNNTGSTAQITVVGTVVGGSGIAAHGVYGTGGFLRLDALLSFGANGCAPVQGQGMAVMFKRTGSLLAMQAPSDDNWPAATGASIVVERYTTGNPIPADVRSGTTFGPGATSTGTLEVPPAASVASGVPVDATVGTAALKLSDVAALTGGQVAAALA